MITIDLIKNEVEYFNVFKGPTKYPIGISNFPDGHKHVNLSPAIIEELADVSHLVIKLRIKSYDDLFLLEQVINAIEGISPKITFNLNIVYLLAARYDRRMYEGDSEDLKILASHINRLKACHVNIAEPHSNITTALIDRSEGYSPIDAATADYILNAQKSEKIVIFAPDLGAVKRTEHFVKEYSLTAPVGILHKDRDLLTGQIRGMKLLDGGSEGGYTAVLYDDLCDGGRTFIEASAILREHGATKVVLAITHGLFSKGVDALLEANPGRIDHIITSNSYQEIESSDRVTVIPV